MTGEMMFGVFFLLFCYPALTLSAATTCQYLGRTYYHGDSWADKDVCNACICNDYGVSCRSVLDTGRCPLSGKPVHPGDIVCSYAMSVYAVRDVFTTLDGCNTCLCTEWGMACTASPCNATGFAQPSQKELYGHCRLADHVWYPLHSHWLAQDGCNTCYCYLPGNYQGMHVCTTSSCTKCPPSNPVVG